jgi:hypothetical protein
VAEDMKEDYATQVAAHMEMNLKEAVTEEVAVA